MSNKELTIVYVEKNTGKICTLILQENVLKDLNYVLNEYCNEYKAPESVIKISELIDAIFGV